MPPRFAWQDGDIYLPLNLATDPRSGYDFLLKLKPGVSTAAAEAEFSALYHQFDHETPNVFPKSLKISVRRFVETHVGSLGKTMYLLLGAVALLLAIGCGNLSILLLARNTARRHEFAIRSAIGASRSRIVRQLLTESLLLSLAGAGLGVLVAFRSVGLIVSWLPEYSFPHEADFHINLPVLCFSVTVALLCGVVFGLVPAAQSAQPQIIQVMQASTRRLTGNVKSRRTHTALIAGQIALTLLLMTAGGAAIRGFTRLNHVSLGYDPQHVMSVVIPLREDEHTTWADRAQFFRHVKEKIAETPGVIAAGISFYSIPPDSHWVLPFDMQGKPAAQTQEVHVGFISSEYFATLQIPLLAGRLWEESEIARGATLVLVNETFVKRYLTGGEALGRSIRIPRLTSVPPYRLAASGSDGWLQIIGVVKDSLDDGLARPVAPAVYAPFTLLMWPGTQILVRTQGEPLAALHSVRKQVAAIDPDQQIAGNARDLQDWIQREPEYARVRLIMMLFGAFSALAMILAAVGLYSVLSYTVLQRTNELGVRVALGAQRRDVLRIVVLSAGRSVGLGITAGLALSFGLNRIMARFIENGTHDPIVILTVSLLLVAVAILACLAPARRALAVDPIAALRCE